MKRSTIKLLFWAAVAYGLLLVVARGIFPSDSTPAISLTGIPLVVTVVIILRDLIRRSTTPTEVRAIALRDGFKGSPVEFLSGQIRVAANASNSYFEDVVRSRLRELLVTKAALETRRETDTVRLLLLDSHEGPKLLREDRLYQMLYGPVPEKGLARMRMIEDAVTLIEAWKG